MSEPVSPLYAAIDLGSNSFHMLVVREVAGSVQTLAKIKRKVRLAAGLDKNNSLSIEAMQRGWDCLSLFAERLQDIPATQIRIVGTATLRTATNIDQFLERANAILGHQIQVISGEEEAATIYQGVSHTSGGQGRRLVVDIGGASTELIIGNGFKAEALTSLNMGCVTWLERHFNDRQLNAHNFSQAIAAAKASLAPILAQYQTLGWETCIGASGTVQALQEIMLAQGMDEVITLDKLYRLQKQAMLADALEELEIEGLTLERALVFPSGLSILIAIFELLEIDTMTLAGGALREGMVYGMLSQLHQQDIIARTLTSIKRRYQLDAGYAKQASECAQQLLAQCDADFLPEPAATMLLDSACQLHELGVTLDYKKAGQHNAYLIANLDLPGFTKAQQHLLSELLKRYKDVLTPLEVQHAISQQSAERILRLLRVAIILTHRRDTRHQPLFTAKSNNGAIALSIDEQWLAQNPLTRAELDIESDRQSNLGWTLTLN
jgi:exopolyphosphatase/guanosine-5'-triphosphate,3'-diphosphate pyrophosphatase